VFLLLNGTAFGRRKRYSPFKERAVKWRSKEEEDPSICLILQVSEEWVMKDSKLQVKTRLKEAFTILTSSPSRKQTHVKLGYSICVKKKATSCWQ